MTQSILDAIRAFPQQRAVEHCDQKLIVSPFDRYAVCPHCEGQIKLRAFSAAYEIADVFDAVFEWMNPPGALELVKRRQQDLEADKEE